METIRVAMEVEENDIAEEADDGSVGSTWSEDMEAAKVHYKHTLRRLKRAYPDELCAWTDDGVCEQRGTAVVCVVRQMRSSRCGHGCCSSLRLLTAGVNVSMARTYVRSCDSGGGGRQSSTGCSTGTLWTTAGSQMRALLELLSGI